MSIGSPSAADAIKASLKTHNDSFDQLLRHIPAQYYFLSNGQILSKDKLSKSQKQALKKQAEKPQVKQAKADKRKEDRIARYDPNEPHTIPEILSMKAHKRAKKDDSGTEASDDESGDESEEAWQDAEDSPNDTDFNDSDLDDGIGGDENEDDLSVPTLAPRDPSAPVPTVSALREKLQKRIGEIQAMKRSKSSSSAKEGGGEDGEVQVKSKDDLLEERRRRGALRDNRRKKRKEERKQQMQSGEAQKRKKEERGASNGRKGGGKANAPGRIEAEEQDEDARPAKKGKTSSSQALVASTSAAVERPPADAFTFSNLDFTNSQLAVAQATTMAGSTSSKVHKLSSTKKNRHDLPKNANAALAILERRKEKLATLTDEQREKVQDKEKWEKAGLRAEGEKIRDDEKRLKKMAKRQERQKGKSAKAWAERKETVKDGIAAKVAKRNMNLAAREKQRKDKKMGIKSKSGVAPTRKTKSKSHAGRNKTGGGRPGFEGKGKKK